MPSAGQSPRAESSPGASDRPAASFKLAFSTYLSGSGRANGPRAVAVDAKGNIYVSGGTSSPDFPTTPGAHSRKFDGSGKSAGNSGPFDAYVTKLTPDGRMVWSTLVGGPNHDRTYSIRVDRQGCVYIAGRAGEGFPTTKGVLQEKFAGDNRPAVGYGPQDGFITKLSADGSRVLWSTYLGSGDASIIRDMIIDGEGNAYVAMIGVTADSPYVTPGAFQATRPGAPDGLVGKISSDGRRVVWASYLGGSGREGAVSIRLDSKGHVIVSGSTTSKDFPVTDGAYQRTLRGPLDAYVAKFAPDGSRLVYATYLGGSKEDGGAGKHGLEVDADGNAYVVGFTSSSDFPTTAGALQATYAGGQTGTWEQTGDRFIAKLSPDGRRLLAATYLGGDARDGGEGIAVDRHGQVYLSGFTYSTDFPVAAGAPQARRAGKTDGTATVLSADFTRLVLSSHFGGRGEENFRAIAMCPDGGFVIVGETSSADWPVLNALQPRSRGGGNDAVVLKFVPAGAK
ncbi:MAG: hypothetical protein AMJ81_04425 [Phycisphaerae bacterium SM23_33]|nr:MAG: hypothetical protein AMJ81_04425 [Phycisphaerae bacterium SM23_33]